MAAVDYFLKIDSIQGESNDDKHKSEIDVISFSWNVTHHEGRARITDFKIVKAVDRASPLLVENALQCTRLPKALFVARRAGKDQQEYLKLTLNDVLVTSVSPSSGSDEPLETVTLSFRSGELKVAAQKRDGTLDQYVTGVIDPQTKCGDDHDGH
jgi:type VI secretion system secreted protein Hcp